MNHQVVDLRREKKRGLEREWERGCNLEASITYIYFPKVPPPSG